MKNNDKKTELDVDFIGSQVKPITIEEEQLISAFIKKLKTNQNSTIKTDLIKSKKKTITMK